MTVKSKKLAETIRPLMFVSQLLGVTYPTQTHSKRFKLITIYRVVILVGLTLALIREVPTIMFWTRNLKGVHGMLAFIETRLRWLALFVNYLLTCSSNSSINKVISSLINGPLILKQKEYIKLFKLQIYIIVSMLVFIICYTSLGHDFIWLNPYYKWYSSTIYAVTEFYIGFSNLQFLILLIVIKKHFTALNENLKTCDFQLKLTQKREGFVFFIGKGSNQDRVFDIVKFKQIHMNLTTACWKTNQCFTIQILLFLLVSLIEITYSLRGITIYSVNSEISDTNQWRTKPFLELGLVFFWGGYYLWSILQIVIVCEATVFESQKTGVVVHELINKIEDKEVEKQLQLFSLQLMNHKVVFSAGQCVELSYPLLISLIGTVTTYLVIIITLSN